MRQAFIGVDVGTTSARAGLFDAGGTLLATARRPIALWREAGDIAEQSSEDIWQACAGAVRDALAEANVPPALVKGIGFDATSSLAVLDRAGKPLSVSLSGDPQRNVIVWMDHRAIVQARRITETGDPVLRHVGGIISPEMETPKLLWLKETLPATYHAAGHFLDLADYLTWRATGSTTRSLCTVTCKWTYLAHERRWSPQYFERIGLADLLANNGEKIGSEVAEPGTALGTGLTPEAALALGLLPGTPVGASLIDAHAGGVGTIGGQGADGAPVDVLDRLAYVMGTSACIMATTEAPCFVPGVWGPYFSAMVPGLWLNEGGQSATGAAIDHLVLSHPAYPDLAAAANAAGVAPLDLLERGVVERFGSAGGGGLARARPPCAARISRQSFAVCRSREHGPSSPVSISTGASKACSGCSWRGFAGSPTGWPTSSTPCGRRAFPAGRSWSAAARAGVPLCGRSWPMRPGYPSSCRQRRSLWCSAPPCWGRSRPARSRRFAPP